MLKKLVLGAAIVSIPGLAFAQNAPAAQGGTAAGATTGAIGGAIGGAIVGGWGARSWGRGRCRGRRHDRRSAPRFLTYVVEQRRPSCTYAEPVVVGAQLPDQGVTYNEVPAEYAATSYRYTVVGNRTLLMGPQTHRVVQLINSPAPPTWRRCGVDLSRRCANSPASCHDQAGRFTFEQACDAHGERRPTCTAQAERFSGFMCGERSPELRVSSPEKPREGRFEPAFVFAKPLFHVKHFWISTPWAGMAASQFRRPRTQSGGGPRP